MTSPPALRTPHSALLTPHSALCTLHSALRTLHPALCTPHSALCTPHFTAPRLHAAHRQRGSKSVFRLHYSVVGYQTKTIEENYNWTCNTFKNVDGSDITLANFKVDPDQFMYTTVEFFNNNGGVNQINDPDMGKVGEKYMYIPAEYTECGEDGWYFFDDGDGKYNRKDRVIAFGESFVINTNSGEEGAPMTFSGQVSSESVPVAIEENYNWLGNCAPKQITLADLTVDPEVFMYSTVEFFNNNGGVNQINDPDMGKVGEKYMYIPAEYTECGEDGWYFFDDGDGKYNRKDRVIAAGEGFVVNTTSGEEGAVITLPSAL